LAARTGILICLTGNLIGYLLTIAALLLNSLVLLFVARAISGFTAGNQPIAQAALIDISEDDQQKTRYLGFVLAALSLGLVVGPLMGGVLSDPSALGSLASNALPFYAVSALVVINIVLVVVFFRDTRPGKGPVKVRPSEVFLTLYEAVKVPVVLKLALVFFFAQLALNTFYVFMDDYYYNRFGFGTLQNAIALVVLGASMGLASIFLVPPINQRYRRIPIIVASLALMGVSVAAAAFNPSAIVAYVLIVPFMVGFAVYYPTIVTMFSASVDEGHQGWVMGVTVALYTLGAGLISLVGGSVMSIDIHMPMIISAAAVVLSLILVAALWRGDDIKRLDPPHQRANSPAGSE
jgi:DHA1 family tetracycline resistance protein-like MFS transporter